MERDLVGDSEARAGGGGRALETAPARTAPVGTASLEAAPHHGGFDASLFQRLGVAYRPERDFSVNANPYGPSDSLVGALQGLDLTAYPDPQHRPLLARMAAALGVETAQIAVDAGAARLIHACVHALCGPERPVVAAVPAFGEVYAAAAAAGARVVEVALPLPSALIAGNDGEVGDVRLAGASGADGDALAGLLAERARDVGAGLVYLVNPCNPTGTVIGEAALLDLIERLDGVPLVLDEAYLSVSEAWALAERPLPGAVVRLRSLTKEQGTPGLRMGYAVGAAGIVAALRAQQPAWVLGAAAEAGIAASVLDRGWLPGLRSRWFADRDRLVAAMEAQGWEVFVGSTPYVLVRCVDGGALRDALLSSCGVLVRDCASFGLSGWIRVSARGPDDNAVLVDALGGQRHHQR